MVLRILKSPTREVGGHSFKVSTWIIEICVKMLITNSLSESICLEFHKDRAAVTI